MRRIGLALSTVALTVIVAPAAWGDVIMAKRAKSKDAPRVEQRLQDVGVPASQAREQTAKMTTEDLAYFACGDRVQVVAGLTLQEWLIGGGFLAFMGVIAFIIHDDAQDKN